MFDRYTNRFPPGRLDGVFIKQRVAHIVTVCATDGLNYRNDADDGRVWDPRALCADIDLGEPRGKQVIGGYHIAVADEFPRPYDCFGEARDFC